MLLFNFIAAMLLMLVTICIVVGSIHYFLKWYVELEKNNESK